VVADDPSSDTDEAYQSLYRRYRPQRFEDVRGQEHVTRALRNAVRDDRVAHAYLFSGPRGTGKTSTARILAMALNCAHPVEGEPDGTCPSCVDIRRGASLDVHELDAASNRKLDEMRDLLSRVALGTRGRWKVYIVDEVHQLTSDAASALLKTLEEPPGHVVFVLATTDPQKVLPTIRSRTQHFEFRLLGADVLTGLLRDVNERAALGLAPQAIDLVVRRGHGSARDALSVLDQVAAAGGVEDETEVTTEITDAVADQDVGRVLMAVAEAMSAGRDPRRLATDLLDHLRNGFLATQARGLVRLPDDAVAVVEQQVRRLGLAGVVKAMEVVGQAAVDMRDSVDPRVTLEVALVRLASPRVDAGTGPLVLRLEQPEAQVAALMGSAAPPGPPGAGGRSAVLAPNPARPAPTPPAPNSPAPAAPAAAAPAVAAARTPPSPAPPPAEPAPAAAVPVPAAAAPGPVPAAVTVAGPPPPKPPAGAGSRSALGAPPPQPGRSRAGGRPDASRPALGALRRGAAPARPPGAGPAPPARGPDGPSIPNAAVPGPATPPAGPPASGGSSLPTRDELTKAWGDQVLSALRPAVKVYVSAGRFVDVDGAGAVYALPDQGLLTRALPLRGEVEAALAAHFSMPVPVRFVLDAPSDGVDGGPVRGGADGEETADADEDEMLSYDLDDLADAGPAVVSPEQRLLEAFPGAEEVTSQ
jgi:DNA polymerase-3 subunit gamma/tau